MARVSYQRHRKHCKVHIGLGRLRQQFRRPIPQTLLQRAALPIHQFLPALNVPVETQRRAHPLQVDCLSLLDICF